MPLPDIWNRVSDLSTAWLLTYLLHSSLLLGAAWALTSALARRWLPAQERIWRAAMLGALVTASLQIAVGWRSPLSPVVGAPEAAARPAARSAEVGSAVVRAADGVAGYGSEGAASGELGRRSAGGAVGAVLGADRVVFLIKRGSGWLTAAWAVGAALLVLRLLTAHLLLAGRLRQRRQVRRGAVFRLFRDLVRPLAGGSGMRLTASHRLEVPIARGLRHPEVCLPARVETELPIEQQETILAHEVAHLARRDPAWLVLYRALESLLFVQPLNWLAARRLEEIAEYRCDDWAVERTGRPVTLAKCLTRVADWTVRAAGPLPVPTMAARGSRLGRRVRRLLERDYPQPAAKSPAWLPAAAAGALLFTAVLAPGFAPAAERVAVPEPPPVAEVPQAPEAPEAAETPVRDSAPPSVAAPAAAPRAVFASPPPPAAPPLPVLAPGAPSAPVRALVPTPDAPPPAPAASSSPPRPAVAPTPPRLSSPPSPKLAPAVADSTECAEHRREESGERRREVLEEARERQLERARELGERERERREEDAERSRERAEELRRLEAERRQGLAELESQRHRRQERRAREWAERADERLERHEEALELAIERTEEVLDSELERLEEELERVEERLEARSGGRRAERFEAEIEAFEDRLEGLSERFEDELEALYERLERLHEGVARDRVRGESREEAAVLQRVTSERGVALRGLEDDYRAALGVERAARAGLERRDE